MAPQTLNHRHRKNIDDRHRVEAKLDEELERIRIKLGLNNKLRVAWMPHIHNGLSGEVREGVIYIYEAEEDKALHALRHELIDHLITSRIIKPLVNLVNLLIKSREAEIYKDKEKLVEMLLRLLV